MRPAHTGRRAPLPGRSPAAKGGGRCCRGVEPCSGYKAAGTTANDRQAVSTQPRAQQSAARRPPTSFCVHRVDRRQAGVQKGSQRAAPAATSRGAPGTQHHHHGERWVPSAHHNTTSTAESCTLPPKDCQAPLAGPHRPPVRRKHSAFPAEGKRKAARVTRSHGSAARGRPHALNPPPPRNTLGAKSIRAGCTGRCAARRARAAMSQGDRVTAPATTSGAKRARSSRQSQLVSQPPQHQQPTGTEDGAQQQPPRVDGKERWGGDLPQRERAKRPAPGEAGET